MNKKTTTTAALILSLGGSNFTSASIDIGDDLLELEKVRYRSYSRPQNYIVTRSEDNNVNSLFETNIVKFKLTRRANPNSIPDLEFLSVVQEFGSKQIVLEKEFNDVLDKVTLQIGKSSAQKKRI